MIFYHRSWQLTFRGTDLVDRWHTVCRNLCPHRAMAQFLRGKQAGIQRDFSAGLDPQRVAVDLVPLQMSTSPETVQLSARVGSPVWHQLSNQHFSLRPRAELACSRYSRNPVWQWTNLHLRTSACLCYAHATTQGIRQNTPILRR